MLKFAINNNTELGTNKCVPYRIGCVPSSVGNRSNEEKKIELGTHLVLKL